jgi:hypothetical protein
VITALFIIALVVAALGIPGALPWQQFKTIRWKAVAEQPRLAPLNPRPLVDWLASGAGTRLRSGSTEESSKLAVPTLKQLREHALDDIEDAFAPAPEQPSRRDGGSGSRGGKVGGGRERPGKIGSGRQDPPAPAPRPRWW